MYPTTVGGSSGVLGGVCISGGVKLSGLSLTSRLNDVTLSGDVLSPSEFSTVVVLTTSFPVVVALSSVLSVVSVIVASSDDFFVGVPIRTSPNSISQACASQSLWIVLTSGSGR